MEKIKFNVVERYCVNDIRLKGRGLVFEENKWDDYGFKTTFSAYYYDVANDIIPTLLGGIQIAEKDAVLDNGRFASYATINNIPKEFEELGETYISMGNESYYENLHSVLQQETEEVLKKLNDLPTIIDSIDDIEDSRVFNTSFLRGISLQYLNEDLRSIASNGDRYQYDFALKYELSGKEPLIIDFSTDNQASIPTNMHALIGNNGTGKTTLLSDLFSVFKTTDDPISSKFERDYNINISITDSNGNTLEKDKLKFNKVIFTSYSIFDDIDVDFLQEENELEFIRIGNSKVVSDNQAITTNFEDFLTKIVENMSAYKLFNETIDRLNMFRDETIKENESTDSDNISINFKKKYVQLFNSSSSGQKIVLEILAGFISEINARTLLIFDEPELYLHPPLLSNLMRSISNILKTKNGLGIMATHSPVVLQEIPKNCVHIITNTDEFIKTSRPERETFGDNISSLMDGVFELDIKQSGFYTVIDNLISSNELSIEEINNIPLGRDGDLYRKILLLKNKGEM